GAERTLQSLANRSGLVPPGRARLDPLDGRPEPGEFLRGLERDVHVRIVVLVHVRLEFAGDLELVHARHDAPHGRIVLRSGGRDDSELVAGLHVQPRRETFTEHGAMLGAVAAGKSEITPRGSTA